jgi:uncharacterized protein YbaR (Trm112 family)
MVQSNTMLDELWRCPKCHGHLRHKPESLICRAADCRLSYPVIDGIPVMLIDQATELASDQWNQAVQIPADSGE